MVSAAVLAAALLTTAAPPSGAHCASLLAEHGTSPAVRPISADDLLRLRDIGQPDTSVGGRSPLAVSPDGRWLAFVVSRADPDANTICQGLVVVAVDGSAPARLVDSGGEVIRSENIQRGSRTGSGLPATVVPAWSPDGRQIAYRKRVDGRTQVWRIPLDRGPGVRVTDAPVDVEDVAWSSDGTRLVFATRPGRLAFAAASKAEARTGYLYDHRVIPANGFGPQLPAALERVVWSIDAGGGASVQAAPAEAASLPPEAELSLPHPLAGRSHGGRAAGTESEGPSLFAGRRIWAEDSRGRRVECVSRDCVGSIRGLWWHPDGRTLLFLRYEGWNNEHTALFRWSPGGDPQRLLATSDALVGCTLAIRELLCLRESSLTPRRVVALNLETARERRIFDPNPEFATLMRPRVERLQWRNDRGLPAWGDLVLPSGTPPAGGWPLVIVQYSSRGFLRGGTGDEYPILPLAAHGMAVLSFQRPPLVVTAKPELETDKALATIHRNWDERRNTHAALMRGLEEVFERGDIDRDRVGITGLSDGATTARYALIAGVKFRAAALSTCCRYTPNDLVYGGIVVADEFRAMGFPSIADDDPGFWAALSFRQAASRLSTPLLLQLSDEEAWFGLETFSALREQNVPVELRVFPDEFHMKWQPAHRAAVYARNLDWFRFWLLDQEDDDPAKSEQYRRWREWRERPDRTGVASTSRSSP